MFNLPTREIGRSLNRTGGRSPVSRLRAVRPSARPVVRRSGRERKERGGRNEQLASRVSAAGVSVYYEEKFLISKVCFAARAMGKLTRGLLQRGVVCGVGKYAPFDEDDDAEHVDVEYNCEQCGHRGSLKVGKLSA